MSKNNFCCVDDFEKFALQTLPKPAADYYSSGAEHGHTLRQNRDAFQRLRIRPRMLIDMTGLTLTTTVLGEKVALPIGIAPTAMQKMAHPLGECANAKAAGALGTIFTLSTISTTSIEELAAAAPNTRKWFQLYIYKDREVTKRLVQRAEKNGFKALVLTVDAPLFGIRYPDVRNEFTLPSHLREVTKRLAQRAEKNGFKALVVTVDSPTFGNRYADHRNNTKLPPHLRLANFVGEKATGMNEVKDGQSSLGAYVNSLFDQGVTWNDVKWLKSITSLPLVLKGILTAEDALIAANLGVAAIQVSNHGGRQLDTVPASIEALPEIVKAVGDRCEIYFDGGVRNGTDVFKALALGAKMVFVGRPALWGLAYDGQQGVEQVLNILKRELHLAMALAGCSSIDAITKSMVVHESYYCHL